LKQEDIIIEARILAVADVIDVMVSHRPYRAAQEIDGALTEIVSNKGILYDSEVVDAFFQVFKEYGKKILSD